ALASLWYISDKATADLMTSFYQYEKTAGVTKAQSLRQAQLALLKSQEYRHPSYWAPYLLIGNWLEARQESWGHPSERIKRSASQCWSHCHRDARWRATWCSTAPRVHPAMQCSTTLPIPSSSGNRTARSRARICSTVSVRSISTSTRRRSSRRLPW